MNVIDHLKRTAEKFPEKQAFTDGKSGLTFRELFNAAENGGTFIAGNVPGKSPVVVFMKKSPEEAAAFFAVLCSGNHYVPIDEEMPKRRIELILENVRTRLIVCDESTIGLAEAFEDESRKVLWSDIIKTPTDPALLSKAYASVEGSDPAYVLFTSGSTGVPKGVACSHDSVANYGERLTETLGITDKTRFGEQAPLYFDASLKEILSTVMTGATTVLIPRELFKTPVLLMEFLNEQKINTLCWVVSALTFVSAFGTLDIVKPEYVETLTFVGEIFPIKQFLLWKKALPKARMFNLYGPTECTGVSTYYEIPDNFEATDTIPVGKPFKGTKLFLLDETGNEAAKGETGEIGIGGPGVALGYYNDPERTKEAFVQHIDKGRVERIYKTGDLGRFDENGDLIFVSRKDYQIKHMGHRIELGEIEADVSLIEGVKLCACTHSKESGKITLFYVGDIEKAELTKALKNALQRYMIPNRLVKLEAMPFTATGKIDRKKLNEEAD
ncbi:MAG: amino acid adenylation domain-containing protein [Lachnospiraceae bacterium]|nr:amino acid adenylation domain-containing protein [Lachnospiraceae bacterium]